MIFFVLNLLQMLVTFDFVAQISCIIQTLMSINIHYEKFLKFKLKLYIKRYLLKFHIDIFSLMYFHEKL